MPAPLIIFLILLYILWTPASIIEEVFLIPFWKSLLITIFGFLVFGIGWFLRLRKNEDPKKNESETIGVVVSLAVTIFIGHVFIRMFAVQFAQSDRVASAITGVLSILFFFLIFNVARNFYDEERGFIKGTKAWFVAIPMFPAVIVLSFVGLLIPPLGGIIGIIVLGWMIYFFGYPLLRGARTMDNFKRKQELKNFATKYQEAVDEGTNLPQPPTRNIPQISGMVSGWFSKLRAKDAVEIAKAHSEISRYAVDTIRNRTDVEIEEQTRLQKIQLAKDKLRWEMGKGDRDDQMGNLSFKQMELEYENIKEEREIKKKENQKRSRELEKEAEAVDEKPEEAPSQEEATEEAKDPFQAGFEKVKNEGDAKLGEAFGRYDMKRKAFQRFQQMRDEIITGRPLEALSESEKHELEDLEDYFYNEILAKL